MLALYHRPPALLAGGRSPSEWRLRIWEGWSSLPSYQLLIGDETSKNRATRVQLAAMSGKDSSISFFLLCLLATNTLPGRHISNRFTQSGKSFGKRTKGEKIANWKGSETEQSNFELRYSVWAVGAGSNGGCNRTFTKTRRGMVVVPFGAPSYHNRGCGMDY